MTGRAAGKGGGGPSVLMIVQQLRRRVPGGVGRAAAELTRALADEGGADVTLWASRGPRGGPDPLRQLGWPLREAPLPGPLLTRAWDAGLVRAPEGFDVVHSTSLSAPGFRRPPRTRDASAARRGAGAELGAAAGPGAGRALRTMTVHDLAWRHFPAATTRRGARWHEVALRRALRQQDHLIVPSEPVADRLRASGAPDGAVSVVPWGSDHLGDADPCAASGLLEGLGVAGPFLLTAATLEPRKNLATLIAAYGQARPRLPEPWPLVVVGPTGWGPALEVAGRSPGVHLAGPVGDAVLAALYERARAFLYVPLEEGFGLPPLEALARGLPSLVSEGVPSVAPEVWPSPVAARVPATDVEAIAAGLVAVAGDDDLRARLAAAGRELADRRTWRATAEAYVSLWRSVP